MDVLTPEQWYELTRYIIKFGLDDEYTDPDDIKDDAIKMAWIGIGASMCTIEYSNLYL